MHRDRNVDPDATAWNESDLAQDLEFDTLLGAMAGEDPFLLDVARHALLNGLDDPDDIRYRHEVLRDFLAHPTLLSELFSIAVEAVVKERLYVLSRLIYTPENTLHRAILDLEAYVGLLRRLRGIADNRRSDARSVGLARFLDMLTSELDDSYFLEIEEHLRRLDFRNDVHMSAGLSSTLHGDDYILHRPRLYKNRWLRRLLGEGPQTLSYTIRPGDERALQSLMDLRTRGVDLVADALAQSTEHMLAFFQALRAELGFYVGCLNLHDRLTSEGHPTCFPILGGANLTLVCEGLYDPCLALTTAQRIVGNDIDARDVRLIVITGANQGGKSTFLRSVGVTQAMVRAGMFAPALSLEINPATGIFTHFRREEDATMTSGKLDEEFVRMSAIVDHLTPGSLVLFNESFSATNEREGSHVSHEVIQALIESGVLVVFVTHLYNLAHGLHAAAEPGTLFLRAPREDDGRRTFRLIEGEPLPTSYGADVYERVFGSTEGAGASGE